MSSASVQPNLPLTSPMAAQPSQPSLSVGASLSSQAPPYSPSATRIKIKANKVVDRFPWIPMVDRPCCSNLKTWTIVQGWLLLVSSLLVISFMGGKLHDNCTHGLRVSHEVWSGNSPRYQRSSYTSSGWDHGFRRKEYTRTPITTYAPTYTYTYKYPYCEGYYLFAYALALVSNGIVPLLVSALLLLGICRVRSDWLLPYVMFFHLRIITDLHQSVFFSDQEHFPATLTVFICLCFLCVDIFFMACANSMRIQLKTDEQAIRAQAGTSRVVQV